MENLKRILFMLLLTLGACQENQYTTNFYFNAGSSLRTNQFHIVIKVSNKIKLDTTIINNLNYDRNINLLQLKLQQKSIVIISVNSKLRSVILNHNISDKRCVDLLVLYDDWKQLRQRYDKLIESGVKVHKGYPDYKRFIDSVTDNRKFISKFDSIILNKTYSNCDKL